MFACAQLIPLIKRHQDQAAQQELMNDLDDGILLTPSHQSRGHVSRPAMHGEESTVTDVTAGDDDSVSVLSLLGLSEYVQTETASEEQDIQHDEDECLHVSNEHVAQMDVQSAVTKESSPGSVMSINQLSSISVAGFDHMSVSSHSLTPTFVSPPKHRTTVT